jgi:hypothetical protein
MHAQRLDDRNGNTQWQEATTLELTQLQEYNTFKDYGHRGDAPNGYKKIRTHLAFVTKPEWLRTVTSPRSQLRACTRESFHCEDTYLEAETQERVYIPARPEFGEREGHTLVIFKALYGLQTQPIAVA